MHQSIEVRWHRDERFSVIQAEHHLVFGQIIGRNASGDRLDGGLLNNGFVRAHDVDRRSVEG